EAPRLLMAAWTSSWLTCATRRIARASGIANCVYSGTWSRMARSCATMTSGVISVDGSGAGVSFVDIMFSLFQADFGYRVRHVVRGPGRGAKRRGIGSPTQGCSYQRHETQALVRGARWASRTTVRPTPAARETTRNRVALVARDRWPICP